ncbi:hypothetical protein NDU88_009591 [Pleurodeles waltl]|uniref:Uncharacterized protein n=1 Tax=Pleurodeles waltl TaxID=8319 RepID=A0AAV7QS07_PLEWA|nr:hypothetical protein NDU88_009591 [Pleurodeles waltl]
MAPGVWSAEPRGLSALETPNLGAADRACGRPPGPLLGCAGWCGAPRRGSGSPGRALPARDSMPLARRSRPEGGPRLGRGLVPGPASLPEGRRHSRASDFLAPGVRGPPRHPSGPGWDKAGSSMAVDLGG